MGTDQSGQRPVRPETSYTQWMGLRDLQATDLNTTPLYLLVQPSFPVHIKFCSQIRLKDEEFLELR